MSKLEIRKLNHETVTQRELEAYTAATNRARAETLPDDPPRTVDYWRKQFAGLKDISSWEEHRWLAWDADEVAALAWSGVPKREDNKHVMDLTIHVLPEYRRQGLATRLLGTVARLAKAEDRTLLILETNERVPAGAAFAEALGAKLGIEDHTNQLELKNLDRALIQRWQEEGKTRAKDFELGCWVGPYPEDELEAVCGLIEMMNTEPRGELEVEDFKVTPEHLKEDEAYFAKIGLERWTFYARHRPTGEFAGFTQTAWSPDVPQIVRQWGTAVKPEYRGKGLGKWLKAAMLDKILKERPQVTRVRTGNADVNAPMLAINHRLGFKPYMAGIVWQLDRDGLETYLENRAR